MGAATTGTVNPNRSTSHVRIDVSLPVMHRTLPNLVAVGRASWCT
jgi:hypothetical protein